MASEPNTYVQPRRAQRLRELEKNQVCQESIEFSGSPIYCDSVVHGESVSHIAQLQTAKGKLYLSWNDKGFDFEEVIE